MGWFRYMIAKRVAQRNTRTPHFPLKRNKEFYDMVEGGVLVDTPEMAYGLM